jgi:hypothetical protein
MDAHSWNEHAEDGPGIEPTTQEGTRFLDGIKWAKYPRLLPSTYTYGLSTENGALVKTGAGWAMQRKLATTCWNNALMVDSTANDTIALTHVGWQSGKIYGDKCSGCGSFTVQVDGSTVATVSTSNGSTLHHQMLWSSGSLGEATHTVQATIVGDGQVGLDEYEITSNPRVYPF